MSTVNYPGLNKGFFVWKSKAVKTSPYWEEIVKTIYLVKTICVNNYITNAKILTTGVSITLGDDMRSQSSRRTQRNTFVPHVAYLIPPFSK